MMAKPGSIYLKTIISSPHELNFLVANLLESEGIVDKFIITEFDHTHSGEKRDPIFQKISSLIPLRFQNIIEYRFINMENAVSRPEETGSYLRKNEKFMRRGFLQIRTFSPGDLIISVDADEVIYRRTFKILKTLWKLAPRRIHLQLTLHQFMYKPDISWFNLKFRAPVAASYDVLSKSDDADWRYSGLKYPFWAGCHFSWHLPIPDMLNKLNTYGHKDKFQHFANSELLRSAIHEMKYPFEPDRDVRMRRISIDSRILPNSVSRMDWSYLDE